MPKIEFNKKAIEAIKRRKKGLYKRWLKERG
jgi:restriction endonuclease S subunit